MDIEVTPEDSVVPIYVIATTPESEADRRQIIQEHLDRDAAEQARIAALESARAKFRAIKLTEEEIDAVFSKATLS